MNPIENIDVDEHAKIIADHVFHSFPYKQFIPNFKGAHAEDCEGCIVEAEVAKLVAKLKELSPVEDIIAELERQKEARRVLVTDRRHAFEKAKLVEYGTVTDLVADLIKERDRLLHLVDEINHDLETIRNKIR